MTPKDTYVDAMLLLIEEMSRSIKRLEAQADRAKDMAQEKFMADLERLRLRTKRNGPRHAELKPTGYAASNRAHCPIWPDPGSMD